MDLLDKTLALLFSLLILMQAVIVRRLVGTWIFPACLFGLFWFVYTFFPLVVLFFVPVEPLSVGFIFLCCLCFSLTAIGHRWGAAFESNRIRGELTPYRSELIRYSFYLSTSLTIVSLLINSIIQGISIERVIFDAMASSAEYASKRYAGELDQNIFSQLTIVGSYFSVALGGFLYGARENDERKWHILLMALIPSLMVMMTQSAKGLLFQAMMFFVGGVLVAKLRRGNTRLVEPGTIKYLTVIFLVLIPVLALSFISRGASDESDVNVVRDILLKYFASYTSGHVYAFGDWFSDYIGFSASMSYFNDPEAYGFHTFTAIFKLFGSDKYVPDGYYEEYFQYGDFLQTNIFTIFRGLIVDFGLLGAVLFIGVSGFILHFVFYLLLTNRTVAIPAAIFVYMVGYFFCSLFISIFIWNSFYFGIFALSLFLALNDYFGPRRLAV